MTNRNKCDPPYKVTSLIGDIVVEADVDGGGESDIVFKTGLTERARIKADGTGSGWATVLGGSLSALSWFSVKDIAYGAKGDNVTDDTVAVQAAITACIAAGGGVVFFPEGEYLISAGLTLGDHVTLAGAGYASALRFTANGSPGANSCLAFVNGYQGVNFQGLRLLLDDAAQYATLVRFSACFHGTIDGCWIIGTNGSTLRANQIGVQLDSNAGENRIIATEIANLGYGIYSSSIMNYVFGGAITNSVYGVYCYNDLSFANNSGMALSGTTISGTNLVGLAGQMVAGFTHAGPGNSSWLHGVWIEGAVTACQVGDGTGGPSQFYWKGGRAQGTNTCLALVAAHEISLEDIRLSLQSPGTSTTTTYITVDPTGCTNGYAKNVYINDSGANTNIAPFGYGTCTTTSGSNSLTSVVTTTGTYKLGQQVVGAGIPTGSVITAISGATITISQNASASASAVQILASAYPSGWKVDLRDQGETVTTLVGTSTDSTGPGVGGMTGTDYFYILNPPSGSSSLNNFSVRINGGRMRFYWDGHFTGGRAVLSVNGGTSGVLAVRVGTSTGTLTDIATFNYNAGSPNMQLLGSLIKPNATPTYSASITPNFNLGHWQTITVTNNTAFTINAPSGPPSSTQTAELTIEISNTSGGAMGAITWDTIFKLVGGAFTNPATAKKRFIRFEWNGVAWIETSRASADY